MASVEPEDRNLLQLLRQGGGCGLRHYYRDAAFAVGLIGGAAVDGGKCVAGFRQSALQVTLPAIVLTRGKILAAWIERGHDCEWGAEARCREA